MTGNMTSNSEWQCHKKKQNNLIPSLVYFSVKKNQTHTGVFIIDQ